MCSIIATKNNSNIGVTIIFTINSNNYVTIISNNNIGVNIIITSIGVNYNNNATITATNICNIIATNIIINIYRVTIIINNSGITIITINSNTNVSKIAAPSTQWAYWCVAPVGTATA